MKINDLVKEAHDLAKEKGWYDKGLIKSPLETHMLIVSEIAEASECIRNRIKNSYAVDKEHNLKPEGELIELVDAIIRIADYCGYKKWDLEEAIRIKMNYNKTRPYRHGNKAY